MIELSKRVLRGLDCDVEFLEADFFQMDVTYENVDEESVELSFDSKSSAHLTLGLNAQLSVVSLYGEYNIANQSGFAFGLGFGM